MPTVDPEAIRKEGNRWSGLADEMSTIKQQTADLYLGPTAFFPGAMTEGLHWSRYRDYLDQIVSRLEGAAIEFELIGITLRKIADDYQEGDRVSADSFRVTEKELERATEAHLPPPPPVDGLERYQ